MSYSERIVNPVKEYLEWQEWKYIFDQERGTIQFGVGIRGRMNGIRYLIQLNEHDYNVYAVCPISVDEKNKEELRQMMEFVCRANYGLRDGNFELDLNDGEIRFKTYVNANGVDLTQEIVEKSIQIPAAMFERYGPGILQVVFSGASAKDAVASAEEGYRVSQTNNTESCTSEDAPTSDTSRLLDLLRKMRDQSENGTDDKEKAAS